MKDIKDHHAIELGNRIVTLLNVNPVGRDKYRTSLGFKETIGLGRLINTIYNDIERKALKETKGT
jgi:hypothetical protein